MSRMDLASAPSTPTNGLEAATQNSSKKQGQCLVRLLDGSALETSLPKNGKGQKLFDYICDHLNMVEKDYFALSYRDAEDCKYWLDNNKLISKQLKNLPWNFFFEVKFYAPDPAFLQEDLTRYQLCLQLRHDLLSGRLPCSFFTHALLGSYTVQSELGDYDPVDCGPGSDYLRTFHFAAKTNKFKQEDLVNKVAELHQQHKGQTPAEAEMNFLENAKKLAMYGIDFHPAVDHEGIDVNVGVCASGFMIYKDMLRLHRFPWARLVKVTYKGQNFYIKLRSLEDDLLTVTIGYKMADRRKAKRLWRTAVDHHAFFRLRDTNPESANTRFPVVGSRYRYSGRTQYQLKKKEISRNPPLFDRAASKRGILGANSTLGRDGRYGPYSDHRRLGEEGLNDTYYSSEGVEDDGREWYRDEHGRKVYKTTKTTTTTTRYIIEGNENVYDPYRMGPGGDPYASPSQLAFGNDTLQGRGHTGPYGDNPYGTANSVMGHGTPNGYYGDEGPGVEDTRVEKKLSVASMGALEHIDYDQLLRDAILSVTGVSGDLLVDKVELVREQ